MWHTVLLSGARYLVSDTFYSGYSNNSNTTTQACTLAAPSNLTTIAVSQTQINLSWTDNSSDETNFRVERSPNGTSGWTEIATVAANTTTYNDTGLTCGTPYYYRVRVYPSSDTSYSGYSNDLNTTTQACTLAAPSNLTATAVSQTQINLSWTDNSSDETNFRVERSPNGTSGWTEIAAIAANTNNYNDIGLISGSTYYYRVRAYRSSDNNFSPYSNIANATTLDLQSPTVSWVHPVTDGGVYNAENDTVLLEVNAVDNVRVDYVHFYRWDAVNLVIVDIGTDYTAPYQVNIDARILNYEWNEIDVQAYQFIGKCIWSTIHMDISKLFHSLFKLWVGK